MWSGGVVLQRGKAREYPRFWPRDGAGRAEWLRARIPWLAALETERDNVAAPGARSVAQPRGAEEHVEFERLFSQHATALRDYLYGLTRSHEAATDLMQETFLRAWASTTPLADIQQPKAWLYRIATNLALNQSRRQRRFVWLSLETVEPLGAAGSSDR